MALPSPASVNDWSAAITEAALGQMNGSILVLDPNSSTETPYDPITDTGGVSEPTILIPARPARIQHMRATAEIAGTTEWGTKTFYRFQIELRPADPFIPKGFMVRVLDGANDPTLTLHTYEVLRATNSSHAAVRTIECVTDLAVVPELA